jgi:hypothetical protein
LANRLGFIITQPDKAKFHQLIKINTIKNILSYIVLVLFIISFLSCCEKEGSEINNDPDFSIIFSDEITIFEKDILFYDSSTHILFLKKELNLEEFEDGFTVMVDNDTIYQGIIYPSALSAPSPQPLFVSDHSLYGNDIIHIGCSIDSFDFRNDQRIINALEISDLLHHGLKCSIDSINVQSFDDYSKVICTIKIKNNDNINYYILDPQKMGELDFNYYTGGLIFKNNETKISSFLRWSISNPEWSILTMDDFSILKSNKEVSYTFKSSDYYRMDKGIYEARFSFCGTKHNSSEFSLDQKDGRIWVGCVPSVLDNIIVE